MLRCLLALLMFAWLDAAVAAVYKCPREGGVVEYQAVPCSMDRSKQPLTPTVMPGAASPASRQCAERELSLRFSDMPVVTVLGVLADFSGNRLEVDRSIRGSGAFHYPCTAWDEVLRDVARRYQLMIRIQNGTIYARPR